MRVRLYDSARKVMAALSALRPMNAPRIASSVRREGLTYLDLGALSDLHERVRELDRAGREGILIEAGCALGGSAIVIAAARGDSTCTTCSARSRRPRSATGQTFTLGTR